jgi:hypothetical protein
MYFTGQRITYTYTHWLNSKSSVVKKKLATFIRYVDSQRAVIRVDGNIKGSYVKLTSISK